ncbi:hypothetical protein DL93DRAFT_394817 [Clavulina sp. PMI_390]|nr:hypothetical protein DL93DRAFT_394817 [Clavulina sp. PMI_390]
MLSGTTRGSISSSSASTVMSDVSPAATHGSPPAQLDDEDPIWIRVSNYENAYDSQRYTPRSPGSTKPVYKAYGSSSASTPALYSPPRSMEMDSAVPHVFAPSRESVRTSGRLSSYVSPTYPVAPLTTEKTDRSSTTAPSCEAVRTSGRLSSYVSPTYPAASLATEKTDGTPANQPSRESIKTSGRLSSYVSPTYPAASLATEKADETPITPPNTVVITGSPTSKSAGDASLSVRHDSFSAYLLKIQLQHLFTTTPLGDDDGADAELEEARELAKTTQLPSIGYPNVDIYASVYPYNLDVIYPAVRPLRVASPVAQVGKITKLVRSIHQHLLPYPYSRALAPLFNLGPSSHQISIPAEYPSSFPAPDKNAPSPAASILDILADGRSLYELSDMALRGVQGWFAQLERRRDHMEWMVDIVAKEVGNIEGAGDYVPEYEDTPRPTEEEWVKFFWTSVFLFVWFVGAFVAFVMIPQAPIVD